MKLVTLGLSLLALYAIQKYIELRRVIKSVQYPSHPGKITLLAQDSLLSNILPRIPGISMGGNATWEGRYQPYAEVGWDVVANISVLPSQVTLSLADAAAIKEVTAARFRFPKPVWQYKTLSFFWRQYSRLRSRGMEET